MTEPLAARLMALFIAELEEQVELMNTELIALESDPADAGRLRSLFRIAHTLKGAARSVEVRPVERICHALETLLERARQSPMMADASVIGLLYATADALADASRLLTTGSPIENPEIDSLVESLQGASLTRPAAQAPAPAAESGQTAPQVYVPHEAAASAAAAHTDFVSDTAAADSGASAVGPEVASREPLASSPAADRPVSAQLRVDPDLVNELLAATSRLDTARVGIQDMQDDFAAVCQATQRIAAQCRHLSRGLRRLEQTGPTRRLRDVLHSAEEDLRVVADLTGAMSASSAVQTRLLDQAARDVTQRASELRMRPFAEACEGLPRVVRDLATAAGRQVSLEIRGGDVQADRTVLNTVRDAMMQLVRNAVDHGIESADARRAAGKPAIGTLTIEAALVGDRLQVSVADDGAGLNLMAIRTQLERRGRTIPDDEAELARFIFEDGLSTRGEATVISGRGVGLDVVRHAMEGIRGTVDVSWDTGRGTRFALTCPPTMTTLRAVIVTLGSALLAFPSTAVERLVRVRAAHVATAEGRRMLTGFDAPVPIVPLTRILPQLTAEQQDPLAVIVVRTGGHRVALVVDRLITERQVMLRPLDEMADPSVHLSGAALLGPGQVALVLNPVTIAASAAGEMAEGADFPDKSQLPEQAPTVLVVDDSITTRTLEQSILVAAGYNVLTAVDGSDGWRRLQETGADLVIADVEMPGMDGFALCEKIRSSPRFSSVPIILVTSLASPEHRARGLEAGADAYITKSAFDQTSLLETVRQLLG